MIALMCATVLAGAVVTFAAAGGSGGQSTSTRVGELAGSGVVALLPPHGAGEGGWCLTSIRRGGAGGECGVKSRPSASAGPFEGPIIAEEVMSPNLIVIRGGKPPKPPHKTAVVLVGAWVAAVSVEGYSKRIATHANALLPDHLRGAVVKLVGHVHKPLRELSFPRFPKGHLIAWSRNGKRISQTFVLGTPLGFDVPSRSWSRGEPPPPRGICAIGVSGFAEHAFRNGGVMIAIRSHKNVRGREFVNCAHSYYLLYEAWPIEANVLLDAEHPGTTPAPLPGMRPLNGHSGMFIGPSPGNGELARRVRGAWLVVAGGENVSQRVAMLDHTHVTLRIE